jgi:hypothetical protein
MMKNIYIVLFTLLLGIGAVSCDNESEDLFEQSAAERKTEAIKEYDEALKSAEKGWLFQYFPEKNQKYGGYNYVVKFNQNDTAQVWIGLAPDADAQESLYDVISYGGPVLSFNTYNAFMHFFANPSQDLPNAREGDFEFKLMSNEEDVILVSGVKTGNDMRLIKMTETPKEYFTKAKAVMDFLEGSSMGTTVEGTPVTVILSGRVLTFVYNNGKENVSEQVGFIPTDKGIRLYKPIEILGVSAQDFTLDTEKKQFIDDNGAMTIDIAFAPVDLTLDTWLIATDVEADRSAAFKAAYDAVYAANAKTWGEELEANIKFGNCYPKYGDIGISMTSSGYRAHYNLAYGGVVGHDDYLKVLKIDGGFNWKWYGHLEPMVDFIADNAPYKTEIDNADDPAVVKLTSANNPDVWFILRK